MAAVGCRTDPNKPLGPADSYILFSPVAGNLEGSLPVMRRLDIKDQAVQPLPQLLESSFAFEMLRTAYLAKQFVREASADGRRFTAAAQRTAANSSCDNAHFRLLKACRFIPAGLDPFGAGKCFPTESGTWGLSGVSFIF